CILCNVQFTLWGHFSFCLWRNAQLVMARRAVHWHKGSLTFWRWRNAQCSPVLQFFPSVVGATRSCVDSGLTFVDF
ncbi:hypothetical protein A2U01_0061153, partial [Trifolium medium]|nr:hypothetical protein [Trifolium medium]